MGFITLSELQYNSDRTAETYARTDVVNKEFGTRLLDRLEFIKLAPSKILNLGSACGRFSQALQERYPSSTVYNLDLSVQRLQFGKHHFAASNVTCADMHALPYQADSFDLIFSTMALHWSNDFPTIFHEINRLLSPGGLVLFNCLGPDSLQELRACWHLADPDYPHTHDFRDMHHLGDALLKSGLSDPVVDAEHITYLYKNIESLHRELKDCGCRNQLSHRRPSLLGKQKLQQAKVNSQQYLTESGLLPTTFELISGLAWKSVAPIKKTAQQEFRVSVESIKQSKISQKSADATQ